MLKCPFAVPLEEPTPTEVSSPLDLNQGAPFSGTFETSSRLPIGTTATLKGLPPSRRAWAALQVFLCSGLPTQALAGTGLWLVGLVPADTPGGLTLPFVVALSLIDAALLVGLVLGFLLLDGESPSAVLFGWRRRWSEFRFGLLLVPMVLLIVVVCGLAIDRWLPWLQEPINPFAELLKTPRDTVILAFVGIAAGGVREEIQRAFILHRFDRYLGGAGLGLVLFSLLFGAGHFVQGWGAVIITALLGVLWGLVYLARRSIIAPLVSHSVFNTIEVVGLELVR
jgi:membrane protease YdiL (CAAX protease family)